jgi:hypothetical protein
MSGTAEQRDARSAPKAPGRHFLAELRATLRSPLYAAERRRFGRGQFVIYSAVCVFCLVFPWVALALFWWDDVWQFGPVLMWLVLLLTPALVAVDGMISGRKDGTFEAMVLSPLPREKLLRAMLFARLRPFLWLAAAAPLLGVLTGGLLGLLASEDAVECSQFGELFNGVLTGLTWGLPVGLGFALLIAAESMLGGTLGMYFGLRTGRRMLSRILALAALVAIQGGAVLAYFALWALLLPPVYSLPRGFAVVGLWAVYLLVLGALIWIVFVLVPDGLLRHAACHMDRWLLYEPKWRMSGDHPEARIGRPSRPGVAQSPASRRP